MNTLHMTKLTVDVNYAHGMMIRAKDAGDQAQYRYWRIRWVEAQAELRNSEG